jgi:hypothetical protein
MLPVVAVMPVPAVTVVAADMEPRVDVMFPVDATIFPVVAVIPVPAVTVVPPAKDVVVVNEPGAVIAEGRLTVAVFPTVLTVIWLAVPNTDAIAPEEPPRSTHVSTPPDFLANP